MDREMMIVEMMNRKERELKKAILKGDETRITELTSYIQGCEAMARWLGYRINERPQGCEQVDGYWIMEYESMDDLRK
jgi:hypothetical protein